MGVRAMYVILVLFCVVLIFGYRSEHDSVPLALPLTCGGALAAAAIWDRRIARNVGLEECDGGFVDHHSLGSRVIRLDDVERFDHRRRATFDQVFVVLRDGRAIPVQGLQEGQRVVWDGGETHHIVALLNERLATRRQAPPNKPATRSATPANSPTTPPA
jgi:hypothetical protein